MPDPMHRAGEPPRNPDLPSTSFPGDCITAGEIMADLMVELALDAAYPLVRRTERLNDGRQSFEFLDYPRGRPSEPLVYDFCVKDLEDGLQWIAHLSEKRWVTVKHLRIFAEKLLDTFAQGRR